MTKSEPSDRLTAGLLLLLMAVLAGGAAFRESVTLDEVAYMCSGWWNSANDRRNIRNP